MVHFYIGIIFWGFVADLLQLNTFVHKQHRHDTYVHTCTHQVQTPCKVPVNTGVHIHTHVCLNTRVSLSTLT